MLAEDLVKFREGEVFVSAVEVFFEQVKVWKVGFLQLVLHDMVVASAAVLSNLIDGVK